MTEPLGVSAFASLGAVPVSAPLGVSAFSHLGAVPVSPPAQGNTILNNPIGQAAVGAGDALKNTLSSVVNFARSSPSQGQMQNASNMIGGMPLPHVNSYTPIPPVDNSSGTNPTAYNLGNIAGNIGAYLGGGEALGAARAAGESLPGLGGELAKLLGGEGAQGVARRAIGNAAYSGVTAPDNNAQQAERGATWSLGADAIPGAAGKIVQGAQYFMPQRYAQNIIKGLGDGQTLSDATKSVISNVKNAYDERVQNASSIYNSFLNRVPGGSIYAKIGGDTPKYSSPTKNVYNDYSTANSPHNTLITQDFQPANSAAYSDTGIPPSGSSAISSESSSANQPSFSGKVPGGVTTAQQSFSNLSGAYPSLPQNLTNNYTDILKDMHNTFINNPTFANAHNLQSELGAVSRQLDSKTSPKTIGTINEKNSINNARTSLKSDMDSFLNSKNPALAQEYKNISNSYLQDVVPYKTNPKIYGMATGDIENIKPSTLSNIFASPDSDMEKVLGDLPTGTVDKILYTKLGQTVPNKSAQGLLNSFQNLQQQGLGEHISPNLAAQIGELENRIKARNGLQVGSAALAGGLMGAHESATAGALLGVGAGSVASPFMNYISRRLPVDEISAAISNVLRGTYSPGRSAILANQLNNSGVQNGS